ncbi:signal transduction histidine kinase [Actinomadura pelletieri DSM 43383]|uniref:histidine kinase n=1 Tax=Actinomadura pelletieri DSM 43383 TaxID=1120940 RepID=A0A495Q9P5_9ACTN|nr:histidine kinase [Actinomadura pelletieri]RKS68215.1 signal transduction histidine kinase [Actinomadura pelletieri DSM 43383]
MRITGERPVRDVLFDVVAVAIALFLSLVAVAGDHPVVKPHHGFSAAVLVASACSLFWRHRAPLTVAWIAAVTAATLPIVEWVQPGALLNIDDQQAFGNLLVWPVTGAFAAYSVMAFADDRHAAWSRWAPVVVCAVGAVLIVQVLPQVPPQNYADAAGNPDGVAFRSVVFVGGGALLGLYTAARRRLLRGLLERAERAERERHLLAEQVRAEERARVAAEMHDVVTHRVSLMVVQAGALRVTTQDEKVRGAAEEMRATGCKALEELRDVVGLLRAGGGASAEPDHAEDAVAPVPDLGGLISESESVGVPVELVEEGAPAPTSVVIGRTLYRVVQESLTNVRKHAPGARVRVNLRYLSDAIQVTVHNTVPTEDVDVELTSAGSGTGLLGLRQRVELLNGSLDAGPDQDGFRVDVRLPTYLPVPGSSS